MQNEINNTFRTQKILYTIKENQKRLKFTDIRLQNLYELHIN